MEVQNDPPDASVDVNVMFSDACTHVRTCP